MKRVFLLFCTLIGFLFFNSCVSTSMLDHGFYSNGEVQEEVATVIVDKYITVTGIDKSNLRVLYGATGWKKKTKDSQLQKFTINKGAHSISVSFHKGNRFTVFSKVLIAMLEANKEYMITCTIDGEKVEYDIIDSETSKTALLDVDALKGKSKNYISQFINAVLNPTSEEINKTVIEENDDYLLTSFPQMRYELKNKKDGSIQKGYRGFETDFSFNDGIVYLYETDTINSKDEFLKTDYKDTSKIILKVVDCNQKTVTYEYVKPERMSGKKITFNIRVK